MLVIVTLIGFICGIITGLVATGGSIILIVVLISFLPMATGLSYSMQSITSLAIMYTFFSSLSGGYFYYKNSLINIRVILIIGVPSIIGSIIGAVSTNYFSEYSLKIILFITTIIAAIIINIPQKQIYYNLIKLTKPTKILMILTIIISLIIGFLGGVLGVGAGFLFIPLIILVFKENIRVAIGSSLMIIFLVSINTFVIRFVSGHIPLTLGVFLIVGAIIGAQIGARLSWRIDALILKRLASCAIIIASLRSLFALF